MCCHTVSLSQEGLKALSAPRQTMRKVLDNIGVVTGKTTGKQDKCNNPHDRVWQVFRLLFSPRRFAGAPRNLDFWGAFPREQSPAFTPYTLHLILRADWPHGQSVVAVAEVIPAPVIRIEVHAPRVVRVVVRIERTRPIVAVAACARERTVVAVTRSREEDTIAVAFAGYLVAIHTILSCPCPSTLLEKFGHFCIGWHAPCTTPINMSSIICEV